MPRDIKIEGAVEREMRQLRQAVSARDELIAMISQTFVKRGEQVSGHQVLVRARMMAAAYVDVSARLQALEDAVIGMNIHPCVPTSDGDGCATHGHRAECRAAGLVPLVREKRRQAAGIGELC